MPRHRFQFRLYTLLVVVGWVAVACVILRDVQLLWNLGGYNLLAPAMVLLFTISFVAGSAVGTLFGRPVAGAVLGLAIMLSGFTFSVTRN
jgi:hypothetical protein